VVDFFLLRALGNRLRWVEWSGDRRRHSDDNAARILRRLRACLKCSSDNLPSQICVMSEVQAVLKDRLDNNRTEQKRRCCCCAAISDE